MHARVCACVRVHIIRHTAAIFRFIWIIHRKIWTFENMFWPRKNSEQSRCRCYNFDRHGITSIILKYFLHSYNDEALKIDYIFFIDFNLWVCDNVLQMFFFRNVTETTFMTLLKHKYSFSHVIKFDQLCDNRIPNLIHLWIYKGKCNISSQSTTLSEYNIDYSVS